MHATPFVFSASEAAIGNELMGLQGANFGTAPSALLSVVDASGNEGSQTSLPLVDSSPTYLSCAVPSGLARGLYAVRVSDTNGSVSAPTYINKARITSFEFPEVDPGRSFRLFGRNLTLPGATPAVRFVDTATQASLTGTVSSGGDAYVTTIQAPSGLLSGHTYTIYYKNGFGGNTGEVAAPVAVTARASGTDSFGLEVPWGADYAPFSGNVYNVQTDSRLALHALGDGVSDDTLAIQGAIDLASSSGGGVVYLPAGTYKIATFGGKGGGVGLTLKSKVVLKGDGQDTSVLAMAPPISVSTATGMILTATSASVMGIADVSLTCTTQVTGTGTDYFITTSSDVSKFFVLRTTLDGSYWCRGAMRLTTSASGGRFLVSDCTIKNNRLDSYTLITKDYGFAINTTNYLYIRRNNIPNFNRALLLGGANIIYENNSLTYDGDYRNYLYDTLGQSVYGDETSRNRINLSGSNIVILNNGFYHAGAPFIPGNDGENLLAEDTGSLRLAPPCVGSVSSADALSLSDSTRAWTANQYVGFNVTLIDGTGKGQWRTVVANTATTLTLDSPWTVAPSTDTKYTLNLLNVPHLLIKGNTMQNKNAIASLFEGAFDAAIVSNTATNSRSLLVRSDTDVAGGLSTPLMKVLVADNVITATTSERPSLIKMSCCYGEKPRIGSTAFLVEMRRNNITALGTDAFDLVNTLYIGSMYLKEAWHPTGSAAPLAAEGVIVDGNTTTSAINGYGWIPGINGLAIANYSGSDLHRIDYDITHRDGTFDGSGLSWTGTGTLALSGSGSIKLGSLTMPAVLTVEGKFKTTGTNLAILGNRCNSASSGLVIVYIGSTGQLMVWDNNFDSGAIVKTGSSYNDGAWHHFAWTCDGTNNILYVDGAQKTNVVRTARRDSTGSGRIGFEDWPTTTLSPFSGEMDEIRIWNVVRSAADIAANKDTQLAGDESGLIQYWRFSEEAGTVALNSVLGDNLAEGLIGYWRLDGNAADSSTLGNHGTVAGSGTSWVAGCYNQSLHLDGTTNYVSVPDSAILNSGSSMTVHARVKIDSLSSIWSNNWRGIVTKGEPYSAYTGWQFGTYSPTNSSAVGFYFRRGSGTSCISCNGTTNVVAGVWYTVDATYDASTGLILLYVNGLLQATKKNTAAFPRAAVPLYIGRAIAGSFFKGNIDDVKLYNRALEVEEIQALAAH